MDLDHALDDLERQYQREGYAVVKRPTGEQLPEFARGFGAELLATRGDEKVLVRVKLDRAAFEVDPTIPDQAGTTNAQPGWRYDLVITNATDPVQRELRNAKEPSEEQIGQMLTEAERVTEAGAARAGFLLAWAGLEATLRRTAQRDGVGGTIGTSPRLLVREVYAAGYLREEDFNRLDRAGRLRNEVVHGFAPTGINAAEVEYVVGLARQMLTTPGPGPNGSV